MNKAIKERRMVLVLGSLVTLTWTLVRFFIQPIIFDAVGQQVLAHQWLNGFHSGAITGPTNFIIKMLFVYMPVDKLPGSPILKLILVTIVINIVTFIVLFAATEIILKRFKIKPVHELWLVALWTTVTAGSIYWIGFANSRNLEVAAGALLIASGLTVGKKTHKSTYTIIALLSGLLFFADPLQVYMVALPLVLYLLLEWWLGKRRKANVEPILLWAGAALVGFVISKLLVRSIAHIWHVSFFVVKTGVPLRLLPSRSVEAVKQLVTLYSGSADLGRIFFYLNPFIFIVFTCACLIIAWQKKASRQVMLWAVTMSLVDLAVYVLSGSSGESTNSRYLIMTLPTVMVSFTALLFYSTGLVKRALYASMAGVVLLGSILLLIKLVSSYNTSFPEDAHYSVVDKYVLQNNYPYVYASMNTGLPATYLFHENAQYIVLSCSPNETLEVSQLFFDKAYISKILSRETHHVVALILDQGQVITNAPAVCTQQTIVKQLGAPVRIDTLSDGSHALLYTSQALKQELALPAH